MFNIGDINGVQIVELEKFTDERGFLIETFRRDLLKGVGQPAMSYVSWTNPGISRGPHEHIYQTDVFSFIGPGNFELWLWDNRKKSKTFGNKMLIPAGGMSAAIESDLKTVVVPAGVVHGYRNISKVPAMVINYPDKLYKGAGKCEEVDEIRHEESKDEFYLDFIK